MAEEKDETYLDVVKAAVDGQKSPAVEPGPQIEEKVPESAEEPHAEEPAEGAVEAKEAQAETDQSSKDKPEEPEKAVQDETVKPDIARPPKRLPIRTKQRWLSIDPEVRADIWEREAAFDKAHARYDGLGQFAIKAEQSGTTLQKAMQTYNQMEVAIRADPVRGVAQTLAAIGYDPNAFFQHVAQMVNGAGDGNGQPLNGQMQAAAPPIPQGLTRDELNAELANRDASMQIKAFEDDPSHHYLEPYIEGEPLGPIRKTMQAFLTSGIANSLQSAYDMSIRANGLNPSALPNGDAANKGQAEKAAAVNRSRQAAKATIGAPSSSQKVEGRVPDSGDLNWIDTVKAAYNKAKGE